MARTATSKAKSKAGTSTTKKPSKTGTALARSSGSGAGGRSGGSGRSRSDESVGEAFIKLLQSPLVAELIAVAATAALASLAEQGFTSGGDTSRGKRAGKSVKAAGKAAAAAVGRRLGVEIDEIRKAAKAGAKG